MVDQLTQVAGAKSPDGSYALPEDVRVKCPPTVWGTCLHIRSDPCQGRGWNASTDLAVWLGTCPPSTNVEFWFPSTTATAMLRRRGGRVRCNYTDARGCAYGDGTGCLEAFVSARARALVAQGAILYGDVA